MIADASGLPEPDRAAIEEDLLRLPEWLQRHPEVQASVAVEKPARGWC